jgi:hypothetical protein
MEDFEHEGYKHYYGVPNGIYLSPPNKDFRSNTIESVWIPGGGGHITGYSSQRNLIQVEQTEAFAIFKTKEGDVLITINKETLNAKFEQRKLPRAKCQ